MGKEDVLSLFLENGSVEKNSVKIYVPHPLSRTDPAVSLILRHAEETVAELEISIRRTAPPEYREPEYQNSSGPL